jgi:acetolactate synthase-1/2/3 large subunit
VIGTTLVNPDFAAFARSFGAEGFTVDDGKDFAPAFRAALDCTGPSVIELKIDAEALSPRKTLSEVRSGS